MATEGSGDAGDVVVAVASEAPVDGTADTTPWDDAWLPDWINDTEPADAIAQPEPEEPEDRLAAELLAADLRAVDRLAAEILAAGVSALAAPIAAAPDEATAEERTVEEPTTERPSGEARPEEESEPVDVPAVAEPVLDKPLVEVQVALLGAPAPRVQRPPVRRRRAWLLAPLAVLAVGVIGGVSLWVTASARPDPAAARHDPSADASLRTWSAIDVPTASPSSAAGTSSADTPTPVESPAVLHRVRVRTAGESVTSVGPPVTTAASSPTGGTGLSCPPGVRTRDVGDPTGIATGTATDTSTETSTPTETTSPTDTTTPTETTIPTEITTPTETTTPTEITTPTETVSPTETTVPTETTSAAPSTAAPTTTAPPTTRAVPIPTAAPSSC